MKRTLSLLFALAAVSIPAVAQAAPAETVSVEVRGLQRGAVIEGTVSFEAEASSAAGIKKLEVFIDDAPVVSVSPDNVRQKVTAAHDWMTPLLDGGSTLAPNGEYVVRARAVANGGASRESVVRVIVDNPAAVPTGLAVRTSGSTVLLDWDPNPEPDILGYEVQRGDGTTFVAVAQTTGTSFEEAVEPGTYSYRIVAVRNSAARSTGRPSLPTEPVEVTLAAASAPGEGAANGRPGASTSRSGAGFKVKDSSFAPRGLPGAVSLPGDVGQVGLPQLPEPAVQWGTFDKKLPYEIPEGGIPLSAEAATPRPAWQVLPVDGLRWVGAGALLLLIAAALRLAATKIEVSDPNAKLKL